MIFIQFHHYELAEPNDCNYNFIQVFDGINDMEGMRKEFCGSVAESIVSTTNVLYIRQEAPPPSSCPASGSLPMRRVCRLSLQQSSQCYTRPP